MKIALISDIHGNNVALQAVLDDIRKNAVEKIVCLGDVATLGPEPLVIIDELQKIECSYIMGNHDEFLLDDKLIHRYTEAPVIIDAVDWCRKIMTAEALDFIRTFKRTMRISMGDEFELLLFHGSPHSNMEDILATTPVDHLDKFIDGEAASVMAGGHTHIQMLRRHRGTLIINPGSVGLPFLEYVGGRPPTVMPFAEYAIVQYEQGKISVDLKRIYLEKEILRKKCAKVDFPLSNMLIEQYT